MSRSVCWLLIGICGAWLAGCSSGGGPTCSFNDPAALPTPTAAPAPWFKFRHDLYNTGTVSDAGVYAALQSNAAQPKWVFPPLDSPAAGRFVASPVLNWAHAAPALSSTPSRVYIGSTNGVMYALYAASGVQDTSFNLVVASPEQTITGTALIAVRDGVDAVFVGAGDTHLYGVNSTGLPQPTNWPFTFSDFVSAAPTLGADGTLYDASVDGFFGGVCPDGVERFALSTDSIQSSPARGPGGTVYFGANDARLRAVTFDGFLKWAFNASGPIVAAPALEVDTHPTPNSTTAIYVADNVGGVFKVDPNGQPFTNHTCPFTPPRVGPIQSSPALAGDHLYFGSGDNNLYAIDTCTGVVAGTFTTGAPIVSSPAVALNPNSGSCSRTTTMNCTTDPDCPSGETCALQQRIVVIGSNDGNVYFLQDDGSGFTLLQTFSVAAHDPSCAPATPGQASPCAVRSSPAIGDDGTVYVGADDGRVYAIGSALAPPTPTPTP